MRIGIDVGGTNTDAVLMDGSVVLAEVKTPTTHAVTSGVAAALRELVCHAHDVRDIRDADGPGRREGQYRAHHHHRQPVDRALRALDNCDMGATAMIALYALTGKQIKVLSTDTGQPITTEELRYGYRVAVVAAPCDARWRTPAGLQLVGPRYFGYDLDCTPVETRFGARTRR